jgi:thioredoxin reductase (NADPH)
VYDIIIIGAGPAGLTAAIYALRANKKVLLLEKNMPGGQIINVSKVDNYPGVPSTTGFNIIQNMLNQLESFGGEITYEEVLSITKDKEVITTSNTYKGNTIIIANGLEKTKIDFLEGKPNISYCAICDGAFYRGKTIAVVGNGDNTLEDVLYLSDIVSHIYLIVKASKLFGKEELINKVSNLQNITILYETSIIDVNASNKLESIILNNSDNLNVDGLFITTYGYKPNNSIFNDLIELDEKGFIKTHNGIYTNIDGIYAIGDTRVKELRQIVTAASDGALAATLSNKN